ncbi:DUF4230 domain-containing protein [Ichthyenterobacterium magnum]|uniref:Uncharacterized protein DUF4230 n=1 Tax=Ichthyenterobacterium magnum TaxID=1230530 RepID=A0A420DFH6_9FLAO|nr:DUF4230 domain-containing protein [Ichthyenterobacterium magnum]RKE91967.1 uncharacterized protein DUF4230 [Ichthyenterobacterium magnum]
MRKISFGVIITLIILFTFKYCGDKKNDEVVLKENTALIQQELKNVGKLIVTEGHFSQVFDYKNSKALFGNLMSSEKKALVIANADVTISYDLSKIKYELDNTNKILKLISIPEPEIKIHPELEFYDLQQDFFNPFESDDYNKINETVKNSLNKKIEASNLKSNAKNRLISELSKFYILTNSLGWTLQYNETPISKLEELQILKL